MKKIGVINLGSTSTKVAYFEDDVCVFSDSISHPAEELNLNVAAIGGFIRKDIWSKITF